MADGNTHIYFGIGVLAALPERISQKLARDMDAFYLGLQGPDPLIFDPRTQKEARYTDIGGFLQPGEAYELILFKTL